MIMKRASMSHDLRCPILRKSGPQSALPMALAPILHFEVREFVSLVARLVLLARFFLHELVVLYLPCPLSCHRWFPKTDVIRKHNFSHRMNEARAIRRELVPLRIPKLRGAPKYIYPSVLEISRNRLCRFLQPTTNKVQVLALNDAMDHPCLYNFQRWLFRVGLCQRSNALVLGNGEHCRFAGSTIPPVAHHNTIPKQSDERIVALRLLSACRNLFDLCGRSTANIHRILLPFARDVRREIGLSCDVVKLSKVGIA